MLNRVSRILFVICVIAASIPLANWALQIGFGGGALLLVPTCCLGFGLSLVATRRINRIGWFAFASTCTFLLPFSPMCETGLHGVLHWGQDLLFNIRPLYRLAEVIAVFAMPILPWAFACFVGFYIAKVARKLFCKDATDQAKSQLRFTIGGLMFSVMILAGLTAWLSSNVRKWQLADKANTEIFISKFKGSFDSGEVELLGEPHVEKSWDGHIGRFRVTAPIRKMDGATQNDLWAVWTYWCDENYPDTISNFGYAEAKSAHALPPFLAAQYLHQPMKGILDGAPPLGIKATIHRAPESVKPGETIRICLLYTSPSPRDATLSRMPSSA